MEYNRTNAKKQIEKFKTFQSEIEDYLKEIETEYEVKIFFAAELGSRALGTDVEDSDFDISGFFVVKEEDYYKIVKKWDRVIRISQQKLMVCNKIYEIDIELWDIKDWLYSKVTKNNTGSDFWFKSDLVYRNLYTDVIEEITKYITPPYLVYWGKAKSGIGYNEKDIKNKGSCFAKSLMNVETSLFQYLHSQILNDFPIFNILDEIEYLLTNKLAIIAMGKFTEDDYVIIEKNVEYYKELIDIKQKARKGTLDAIPKCLYDFMKLLEKKYNTHMKKCEIKIMMKEAHGQEIFEKLLKLNKL
jgi:predicted nucleotidyltransferase